MESMARQISKPKHKFKLTNLLFLIVFGSAFGFVEAAVVYYLRDLKNFHAN